jgi:hypothetical protein
VGAYPFLHDLAGDEEEEAGLAFGFAGIEEVLAQTFVGHARGADELLRRGVVEEAGQLVCPRARDPAQIQRG